MKHCILIDDDSDDMELFREALQEVAPGTGFTYFDNGVDALEGLRNGTMADLIFLDINMPRISGWEVLSQLKHEDGLSSIPVIMYTTSSSERERNIAADLGASHFITKPADYNELKEELRRTVENVKMM